MKNYRYILILLFIAFKTAFANSKDSINYPVIGKPIPQFTLQNVKYFNKTTITNEDLKGKWFLLDFWGEYCVSCIASFPKMNEINKEFGTDFQIIMIGVPHKQRLVTIEQVYEKFRKMHNLLMPIVYDNKLADQFQAKAFPHQVIVDPNGVVRYITTNVSKQDVADIISGKYPTLSRVYNAIEPKPFDQFEKDRPLLANGNGGDESDYYLRSVLTKGNERMPLFYIYATDNQIHLLNLPLDHFYKYGITGDREISWIFPHDDLYGKLWPEVVLEIKDSTLFRSDYKTKSNLFAYSAFVSDEYRAQFGSHEIDFPSLLRKELELIFPFKAVVERRLMPCYEIFASERSLKKLKSEKNELEFKWLDGKNTGFEAKAMNIENFKSKLMGSLGFPLSTPIFYDGPDTLLDITLKTVRFEDRIKELKEMGIEVRSVEREIDVIVIRDK
ncbi:MAG: TlpA family protein disulfide reductase [Cyclobacteriaceae bacterium]|nr:TlpA family protein disulfide reductase [Cyclobacteriaceae bacterium]